MSGFAQRGIHVDVLVLDYKYKTCDGCTAFDPKNWPDPKGMVSNFKANGTHVMAHVNVEQKFSLPRQRLPGKQMDRNWAGMLHEGLLSTHRNPATLDI